MSGERILELFAFFIPAIITGLVAFYFFSLHIKNEDGRRRFLLHKESQSNALPIRLQAFERMALFLERISITNLVVRMNPLSADKNDYENLLIRTIENELEHNVSQQIYMSDECWNIIKTSKNINIQIIRKVAMGEKIDSADKLREGILTEMMDKQLPTAAALAYVKKEVADIWGNY